MEVAQRVGLRCDGVGYPGHFIVRCGDPESPVYVDPFREGARLDREELLANLRSYDLQGATPESFLAAVTRRQLLQRMLNNLHVAFRERRAPEPWLTTVELLLKIEPWNAALVGERGMLNYRLGRPQQALEDLERYVAATSRTVSAGARRLLDELRLRYGGNEEVR
jgi:regulator of sirC expression with transglutaminase-like and TPR domain